MVEDHHSSWKNRTLTLKTPDPDRKTSWIELELSGGGEISIHTSGFTGHRGGRTQVWFQGVGFGSSLSMDSEELLKLGLFLARFGKRIRDGKEG